MDDFDKIIAEAKQIVKDKQCLPCAAMRAYGTEDEPTLARYHQEGHPAYFLRAMEFVRQANDQHSHN